MYLWTDQLPEIESDEIVISLREEDIGIHEDGVIILYWNKNEIWREVRTYEYYNRYIELGHILKEKYGNKLIDFEVKFTLFLGGDSPLAIDKVNEFRKSLKSNK